MQGFLDLSGTLYLRNSSIMTPMNTITFNDTTGFVNFGNAYFGSAVYIYNPTTLSNIDVVAYVNTNDSNITTINSNISTANSNIATNTSSISTINGKIGTLNYDNIYDFTTVNNLFINPGGTIQYEDASGNHPDLIPQVITNTSNITTLSTKLTNQTFASNTTTWTGNVVFPATSIASTSINNSSFMDLTNTQTVAGVKTFSSAPVLSGASITAGTIPIASVVGTAVALSGAQTITGQKTFTTSAPIITTNLRLDGSLLVGTTGGTTITNTQLTYLSTLTSNVQTQLNSMISLSANNTYTGIQSYNNAVNFNSQFYIASASPLIQIENGNTLRQWSSGTTGDTVMELAWDKGASTTGFSIQGGNDGTRGLFGLYFCTNVAAGTRIPIMYSKDTGIQANNVLTIASGTTATTNLTFSGTLNNVSSAVYGYISGLTSSAQTQLDNKGGLAIQNNWTGGNTFNGQLASSYNAGSPLTGQGTEFFVTGQRVWEQGVASNGDNVFEISLDTGFTRRGVVLQAGESNTAVASPSRSIFGMYYRQPQVTGGITRTPIMYGVDQETGSSLDNTLTIPSSLRMTGTLKLNGGEEISNTQLGYLTTLSENVQSAVNSLKTKLTDLVWTAGSPNKTSIVNTTETSTLTFSNTLNGISTGVFSYLSGVTSSIQDQFTSVKARTPVGSIIMYLKGDLGSPFIFCDGRELNRSSASALFAVIGTTYGAGDGSTTFNIPDMTAIFVRGFGSRTINGVAYASTTGSTLQIDAMEQHTHSSNLSGNYLRTGVTFNTGYVNGTSKPNEGTFPSSTGNVNTSYRTSNETRPINLPVYYYICAS